MNTASCGPWFVNDEGELIIKRKCFDEFGDHCGYQLLEGEYSAIANMAEIGCKVVAIVDKTEY